MPQVQTIAPLHECIHEEFGMTFQVTLVGEGGIVCGSDRKFVDDHWTPARYAEQRARRSQQFASTKFRYSDDANVVCAFAGGPQSKNIATALLEKCTLMYEAADKWERLVHTAIQGINGSGAFIQDEVIIIHRHNLHFALRVSKVEGFDASIIPIEQHICTGDLSGSSQFLVERLWKPRMELEELERLALLTLAFAAQDNPTGIGDGFDILTVRESGITAHEFGKEDADQLCAEFSEQLNNLVNSIKLPEPI